MADPFKPTKTYIAKGKAQPVQLFRHQFPPNTTLVVALQWILKHSIQQLGASSKSVAADPSGVADHIPSLPGTRPKQLYREVSLVWLTNAKRLVAYTLNRQTWTDYDRGLSPKQTVFVAHTHPTKADLGANSSVKWRTSAAVTGRREKSPFRSALLHGGTPRRKDKQDRARIHLRQKLKGVAVR